MKDITELKETAELMCSDDYKERFLAEYSQLEIRMTKLANFLSKWDNLPFEPKCPKDLLEAQLRAMSAYKQLLDRRYAIEFDGETGDE